MGPGMMVRKAGSGDSSGAFRRRLRGKIAGDVAAKKQVGLILRLGIWLF